MGAWSTELLGNDTAMDLVDRIAERLARLRASDSEFKVFGARTHGTGPGWELSPVLTAKQGDETV